MMKKLASTWFCLLLASLFTTVAAQVDSLARESVRVDTIPEPVQTGPKQIAIFIPLYLDSAYDAHNEYRLSNPIPRYFYSGLEFWNGIQLAIDTLTKEGLDVELHIYDTRSAHKDLRQLLAGDEMQNMDLFIGHVTGPEARLLADKAHEQHIRFINVNYPNEAGVSNNPDYVILNSTLTTHCEGIYKFMQRNYALSPIVMFTKKGALESRLRQYLDSAAAQTSSVPLTIKTVMLSDNFTANDLKAHMDSLTTTICIAGSLDLAFGQKLVQELAAVSTAYHSIIVGMPTWDLIDFDKPQYKNTEIIYSTPFYYNPANALVASVSDYYKKTFSAKPTEMVFRGYETLYHFAHELFPEAAGGSGPAARRNHFLIIPFDIQPVLSKPDFTLEYFENKKLFFVKKEDGVVKTVY